MPWLEILITSSATIIASAVTLIISQRYAMKMAAQRELQEDRATVRESLLDFLSAVNEWAKMMEFLAFAFAKMSAQDFTEFTETDSGKRLAELNQQIRNSSIRLSLELTPGDTLDLVNGIARQIAEPGDLAQKLFSDKYPEDERFEAALERFREIQAITKGSWALQEKASEKIGTSIQMK